jgi:integrase
MPVLTALQVENCRPPTEKTVRRLWDTQGLYFEIRKTGTRQWVLKYHVDGRERRTGLGAYPEVSLKAARVKRDELRAQIRAGIDPIEAKRAAKQARLAAVAATAQAPTVRDACEQWITHTAKQKQWTPRHLTDTRAAFALYLFRRLGDRPIADVTPAELLTRVFTPMTRDGGRLEAAQRLRQKLERVWRYAATVHRSVSPYENAAAPLRGLLPKPEEVHFPSVTEGQLPALLAAVRGYGNMAIEACVWLQILTACRPSEARQARWAEFDIPAAVWTLPAARTKMRREHRIPLSPQVLAVLDGLRPLSGHGPLLFPSRSHDDQAMSENTVGTCLRRCGFRHVTVHGFRSTFSTIANDAGAAPPHIIEAALGHTLGKSKTAVEAAYNRSQYFDARIPLMAWWGARVEHLVRTYQPTSVVPFAFGIDRAPLD